MLNYMFSERLKCGASVCLLRMPLKSVKIWLQKYGLSPGWNANGTVEVNRSAVLNGHSDKHTATKQ
jgi:hypothetical protein